MLDGSRERADAREIAEIFEAHAGYVERVLRRFGVRDADVQDLAQDVFVVVCRKLHGFEGRSSIRTWLYRICARTAIDHHRRAYRRYERLSEPPREPAAEATQPDAATLRRTAHALRNALDGLGDDKRAVFVLYELEELTMPEVALVLRCPLQTAFSRLYAARRHVNRALARAGWAGVLFAVGAPARTAWAAVPELRAVLDAWRATLPGAWTLAGLGKAGVASHGVASLAAAACFAAIAAAASAGVVEPERAPAPASSQTRIGVLSAVVLHNPIDALWR